jgi:hypothetical protein
MTQSIYTPLKTISIKTNQMVVMMEYRYCMLEGNFLTLFQNFDKA